MINIGNVQGVLTNAAKSLLATGCGINGEVPTCQGSAMLSDPNTLAAIRVHTFAPCARSYLTTSP